MLGSRRAPVAAALSRRGYMSWSTSVQNISNWSSNENLNQWVLDRIKLMQVGCGLVRNSVCVSCLVSVLALTLLLL